MSEEGEQKTEQPNEGSASESKIDTLQTADNGAESSSGSTTDKLPAKDSTKESRYGKTFQVFQQMGLLEYALQISKLSKDNEQLQQKINKLEKEVNKSSQKTSQDLKDKLEDNLEQVSQTTS